VLKHFKDCKRKYHILQSFSTPKGIYIMKNSIHRVRNKYAVSINATTVVTLDGQNTKHLFHEKNIISYNVDGYFDKVLAELEDKINYYESVGTLGHKINNTLIDIHNIKHIHHTLSQSHYARG
jgi:hypothetical protein